jgi:putative addiction module killer protein
VTVLQYLTRTGQNPFAEWFNGLDDATAARIVVAVRRLEAGNVSTVKGVGGGVYESRLDFGPGIGSISGRTARP